MKKILLIFCTALLGICLSMSVSAQGCGDVFTDSGGTAGGYTSGELTTTTICPTNPGDVVTVTFTYVDIEASTGGGTNGAGCWDFLEVYQGNSTAGTLVGAFCGEGSGDGTIPSDPASELAVGDFFTSTDATGCLTFVFDSDGSVDETGWEADITCAPPSSVPVCGGSFFDTGGATGNYGNSETEVTTICPTNPGDVVTVTFTAFETENTFDDLFIYDGNSTAAAPLAGNPFTGTTSPGTVTSTDASGCLTFEFISDGSVTEAGWEANVTCAPAPPPPLTCGDVFTDTGGTAGGYAANEVETTTICPTNPGDVVNVTFTYVDIETSTGGGSNGTGCWDFLEVYEGNSTAAPLIGSFCGEGSGDGGTPSDFNSNLAVGTTFVSNDASGCLTFVFDSDGSVQETGWEADITCTPPLGAECGGTFTDTGGTGGDYAANETETTTICPDVPGDLVSVTFTYVDIETSTGGGSNGTGCWDFLEVYDGNSTGSTLIGSFCGEGDGDGGTPSDPNSELAAGDVFTSTDASGCLTFVFVSDGSVQETGWNADVDCIPAPIPNDDCTGAEPLTCGVPISGNTALATDSAPPVCGVGPDGAGLWYSFVGNGFDATVSLCGSSYDTQLNIYDGDCATGLNCIVNNDDDFDACGGTQSQAEILPTTAGTTYFVYVDGWNGATGDFDIELTCATCSSPTAVAVPACDPADPDNFFLDVTTTFGSGTSYDIIDADTGTTLATETVDGGVTTIGPFPNGQTINLLIEDAADASCSFELAAAGNCAPNQDCTTAAPIECGDTVAASTAGAATSSPGFCGTGNGTGGGLWYTLVGNGDNVTLDLCNSTYDTRINVYEGDCAAPVCVAGNDDFCGFQSTVTFAALPGITYYFYVNGWAANEGDFEMAVTCVCIDADNDGTCLIDDCDDNDPTLGAELSLCDDGDPATTLDYVQGCVCVGTTPGPDCNDVAAFNYDPAATGSADCVYGGCTDVDAPNYNPNATFDDGSCAPDADCLLDGAIEQTNQDNGVIFPVWYDTYSITITGATLPLTYEWDNEGYATISNNSDGTFSVNAADNATFSLTITDANGCVWTSEEDTNGSTNNSGTGTGGTTNTSIDVILQDISGTSGVNGNDGSITVGIQGGTGPYTYEWTGPNGFTSTDEDLTGLDAGYYTLTVTDADGQTSTTTYWVPLDRTGGRLKDGSIASVELKAYPNPAMEQTTIEFALTQSEVVSLGVFDLSGKQVAHVFKGFVQAGVVKSVAVDASDLAAGVYVCRLESDTGISDVYKLVITK